MNKPTKVRSDYPDLLEVIEGSEPFESIKDVSNNCEKGSFMELIK
jgi:hypothetical protein